MTRINKKRQDFMFKPSLIEKIEKEAEKRIRTKTDIVETILDRVLFNEKLKDKLLS